MDTTDLNFPEMLLGLTTAALAYFVPPLSLLTGSILLGMIVYRLDPVPWQRATRRLLTTPTAQRLLPAPARKSVDRQSQQAQQAQQSQPPVQPVADLLQVLAGNEHRLIIGHTRGGKTTLMHELATRKARAGERVMVCNPDAAPGQFPGCRVVGHGDNYEAIALALQLAQKEIDKRRAARAEGKRQFMPLHLVIDEAQDVVSNVAIAQPVIEDVARRGAKLGVYLTLGVQDKQVKTLGLEGRGQLRRNFATVDVLRRADGQRVAILETYDGDRVTYTIPTLPDPETLITTTRPMSHPVIPDPMLISMLTGSPTGSPGVSSPTGSMQSVNVVPSGSTAVKDGSSVIPSGSRVVPSGSGATFPTKRRRRGTPAIPPPRSPVTAGTPAESAGSPAEENIDDRIRRMLQVPMGSNEIIRAIGGKRSTLLKRIQAIKAELGIE